MSMHSNRSQLGAIGDAADDAKPQAGPVGAVPSPEEALAVAAEASAGVCRHFPWVGPLIESAVLCAPEERRPVQVHTQWGGGSDAIVNAEDADEEKHTAYSEHILRVMHGLYPWLLPLLDASRATLLVFPGTCCFTVHSRLGMIFDIPQLLPFTHLTPFVAETGDVVH